MEILGTQKKSQKGFTQKTILSVVSAYKCGHVLFSTQHIFTFSHIIIGYIIKHTQRDRSKDAWATFTTPSLGIWWVYLLLKECFLYVESVLLTLQIGETECNMQSQLPACCKLAGATRLTQVANVVCI